MADTFIRSRRKAQNLGVPDLASAVGVSETAVWRWDAGQSKPKAAHHERLAAKLGVTKRELVEGLELAARLRDEPDTAAEVLSRARERLAEINGVEPCEIILEMRIISNDQDMSH